MAESRVTQLPVEVAYTPLNAARVTQAAVEVAYLELQPVDSTATIGLLARVSVDANTTLNILARVSREEEATLGINAKSSDSPEQELGLLALVGLSGVSTLGILARASAEATAALGIRAAVQADTEQTLGLDSRISKIAYRHLGLLAAIQGFPQKTLGLLSLVADDVFTADVGLLAKVQADVDRTLGIMASVTGSMYGRLYIQAQVSRTNTPTIGFLAAVSDGPILGIMAQVSGVATKSLGIMAQVAAAGEPVPGQDMLGTSLTQRFLPDDDRTYPGYGLSASEIRARAGAETEYLVISYKNYPNPSGQAHLVWLWDNVYLPINGAQIRIEEPVREGIFETISSRVITVTEEELDTPRATRLRKFEVTFPTVGIQFLKWFQTKLRVGTTFSAEFHLFDLQEDQWEEAYTDTTDSDTAGFWYWGTLPAWKRGSVRVRVDGTIVPDNGATYVLHHELGAVEFLTEQSEGTLVEVQYAYYPRLRIVAADANSKPGREFNRFEPRLTLLEVGAG